jgi:hypothetical protein
VLTVALVPARTADFYTVTPCRVFDSRSTGEPLSSAATRTIAVAAAGCGIPASARAIAANVTIVGPTGPGFVTLYAGNYPQPATSNVNFKPGAIRANLAILQLATDGTGTIVATAAVADGGTVDLVVDVSGYFEPPAP